VDTAVHVGAILPRRITISAWHPFRRNPRPTLHQPRDLPQERRCRLHADLVCRRPEQNSILHDDTANWPEIAKRIRNKPAGQDRPLHHAGEDSSGPGICWDVRILRPEEHARARQLINANIWARPFAVAVAQYRYYFEITPG